MAPIHFAVFNDHKAVVGVLLEAGADKDPKNKVREDSEDEEILDAENF